MLNHFTIGPRQGRYFVAYLTPGCDVPTIVTDCPSEQTAIDEAERLDRQQIEREEHLRADAIARGLYHIYPDLRGT